MIEYAVILVVVMAFVGIAATFIKTDKDLSDSIRRSEKAIEENRRYLDEVVERMKKGKP